MNIVELKQNEVSAIAGASRVGEFCKAHVSFETMGSYLGTGAGLCVGLGLFAANIVQHATASGAIAAPVAVDAPVAINPTGYATTGCFAVITAGAAIAGNHFGTKIGAGIDGYLAQI
jgi:hypothetical protein